MSSQLSSGVLMSAANTCHKAFNQTMNDKLAIWLDALTMKYYTT